MKILQGHVKKVKVTTVDLNEATFYLMYGAILSGVKKKSVPENKREKRGYRLEYALVVDNIPNWAYDNWKTGYTFCNIQDFVRERKKLKRLIKNATNGGN